METQYLCSICGLMVGYENTPWEPSQPCPSCKR